MRFICKNYVRFRSGVSNPYVLVDALHAVNPRGEVFTDEIAERVSADAGCHCIVSTVSREEADLNRHPDSKNRLAVQEYRQTIGDLLAESRLLDARTRLRFPFLHLSLHGMRDRPNKDIELGTCFGKSCSDEYLFWILTRFRQWASDLANSPPEPKIVDNDPEDALYGHPVIATHRCGEKYSGYAGYGPKFNTVQVELAYWLRKKHREELVTLLTSIADEFRALATSSER